jgi:hypothetical protein
LYEYETINSDIGHPDRYNATIVVDNFEGLLDEENADASYPCSTSSSPVAGRHRGDGDANLVPDGRSLPELPMKTTTYKTTARPNKIRHAGAHASAYNNDAAISYGKIPCAYLRQNHDTTSRDGIRHCSTSANEEIPNDDKLPATMKEPTCVWHIDFGDKIDTLNNERTDRDVRLLQCINVSNDADAGTPATDAMAVPCERKPIHCGVEPYNCESTLDEHDDHYNEQIRLRFHRKGLSQQIDERTIMHAEGCHKPSASQYERVRTPSLAPL